MADILGTMLGRFDNTGSRIIYFTDTYSITNATPGDRQSIQVVMANKAIAWADYPYSDLNVRGKHAITRSANNRVNKNWTLPLDRPF